MSKYEDIINIKHFEPKHPRMSISSRAAQFAPFAALTGYDDAIHETGRITDMEKEAYEELNNELNIQINKIESNLNNKPLVSITYFIKDSKKDGGKYKTIETIIKRIDKVNRIIILNNKEKIKIDDIIHLQMQL